MRIPQSLLAQVRKFEADRQRVVPLIKVLGEWKRRIGTVDGVGTALGREEVPFVLRCKEAEQEFGTFEVFGELYRAGLYGMRLEYLEEPEEKEWFERGWVKIDSYAVEPL